MRSLFCCLEAWTSGPYKSAIGGKESHELTDAAFNALIAPLEGRIGSAPGVSNRPAVCGLSLIHI